MNKIMDNTRLIKTMDLNKLEEYLDTCLRMRDNFIEQKNENLTKVFQKAADKLTIELLNRTQSKGIN